MRVFFFAFILTTGMIVSVSAQHPGASRDYIGNHMLWLNAQINGKIAGKFNYGLDVEMRRQADPNSGYEPGDKVGKSNFNIIKNPYQDALRPWIHFQPNDRIRFSWSPITWFGSWSFPVNGKTTYQPEFRTSPQITLYQYSGRIQFTQRYRYEFRFYGVKTLDKKTGDPTGPNDSYSFPESNRQGRFRYLIRAIIPLNKPKVEKGTYYIMTSNEIFINCGKNIPSYKLLDQNRFYLMLGLKFHKEMRIEIGYLNQTAFRMNNKVKNNVDFNNTLAINLIFDNLNSFFKRKQKE